MSTEELLLALRLFACAVSVGAACFSGWCAYDSFRSMRKVKKTVAKWKDAK